QLFISHHHSYYQKHFCSLFSSFHFLHILLVSILFQKMATVEVQSTPATEVGTVPAEIEAKITPETIKIEEVAPVTEETPAPAPTPEEETALVEEKAVPTVEDTVIEPAPAPAPEEEKSAPAVEEAVAEEKTVAAEPEVVDDEKVEVKTEATEEEEKVVDAPAVEQVEKTEE
ncbi:hypothetical protein AABB24_030315, partial [Solanum stoloniferum]